ncbi:UPF0223 family protein [Levilactobacillus bambusae]|uniref:Uncharacterized protein n=1 Tax=Levilactobacillus bambusae TaxID=2024736 RepID=A0A2V1N097_9LACO|nr:UPF0223 family protein [Levilactobacillus bambusae]PWG00669.1 hypothetical protein DCM90_00395 [Levilactobacillus bambusae]
MPKENYEYPLELDWSTDDIIKVTGLYRSIEDAYELPKGVIKAELMQNYRDFKTVVESKMAEKQIDREFERISGFSIYRTIQAAQTLTDTAHVKMTVR